jgi:hypothetical protein
LRLTGNSRITPQTQKVEITAQAKAMRLQNGRRKYGFQTVMNHSMADTGYPEDGFFSWTEAAPNRFATLSGGKN